MARFQIPRSTLRSLAGWSTGAQAKKITLPFLTPTLLVLTETRWQKSTGG
jgi:hypothetical protein